MQLDERLNFSPVGKGKYPFKGKQPNERKIFVSFLFSHIFFELDWWNTIKAISIMNPHENFVFSHY